MGVRGSLDGGACWEVKPFDGRIQGGSWVRPTIRRLIKALKDTLPTRCPGGGSPGMLIGD